MSPGLPVAINLLDSRSLLAAWGPVGVAIVLFVETGLLVGFFLPGDSLLFTAGVLAAAPATSALHLPLGWLLLAAPIGACAGAQTGYLLGRRLAAPLFNRTKHRRLREGGDRAEQYLTRYGHARAIVLARFVPVVRTVLNPLAGLLAVSPKVFTVWQIIGGLLWSVGITLAGYWLGTSISNLDHYLLPIVAVIVALSLIPILLQAMRARSARA